MHSNMNRCPHKISTLSPKVMASYVPGCISISTGWMWICVSWYVEYTSSLIVHLHVPVLVQVFLIGSPVFTPAVNFVSCADNQPPSPFSVCCCRRFSVTYFLEFTGVFSKLASKHVLLIHCRCISDTTFSCSFNRNQDLVTWYYLLITLKYGSTLPKQSANSICCKVW